MNVRMMPPQGPMGQPMPQGGAPAPMGPPMGPPPQMPMGGPQRCRSIHLAGTRGNAKGARRELLGRMPHHRESGTERRRSSARFAAPHQIPRAKDSAQTVPMAPAGHHGLHQSLPPRLLKSAQLTAQPSRLQRMKSGESTSWRKSWPSGGKQGTAISLDPWQSTVLRESSFEVTGYLSYEVQNVC